MRNKSEICHRPLRVHSKGWRFNKFFSFQHFWWLMFPLSTSPCPLAKGLCKGTTYPNNDKGKHCSKILLFWRECSLPLAPFLYTLINSSPKEIRMVCEVGWTPISHAIVVSTISSVVCPRCRMQFQASRWMEKGFWAVYSPTEEETDQNGLPLDLYTFKRGWLPLHPT